MIATRHRHDPVSEQQKARGVSLEEPAAENLHGGIREGGDRLESWPTYTRTKLETADRSQGTPTTRDGLLYSEKRSIPLNCKGVSTLEGKACVELNLAPTADSGEYSADVVGETTGCICEHGLSVSSQRERTLRITRNRKIRMIEEIVNVRSESNRRACSIDSGSFFSEQTQNCFPHHSQN